MARVLTIMAGELREGDVVIHDKNGVYGERDKIIRVDRDPKDGSIYISATCDKLDAYYNPWDHFKIDLDMTVKAHLNLSGNAT